MRTGYLLDFINSYKLYIFVSRFIDIQWFRDILYKNTGFSDNVQYGSTNLLSF